jgi:hypothetical protein
MRRRKRTKNSLCRHHAGAGLSLEQVFSARPVLGCADRRPPVPQNQTRSVGENPDTENQEALTRGNFTRRPASTFDQPMRLFHSTPSATAR